MAFQPKKQIPLKLVDENPVMFSSSWKRLEEKKKTHLNLNHRHMLKKIILF